MECKLVCYTSLHFIILTALGISLTERTWFAFSKYLGILNLDHGLIWTYIFFVCYIFCKVILILLRSCHCTNNCKEKQVASNTNTGLMINRMSVTNMILIFLFKWRDSFVLVCNTFLVFYTFYGISQAPQIRNWLIINFWPKKLRQRNHWTEHLWHIRCYWSPPSAADFSKIHTTRLFWYFSKQNVLVSIHIRKAVRRIIEHRWVHKLGSIKQTIKRTNCILQIQVLVMYL